MSREKIKLTKPVAEDLRKLLCGSWKGMPMYKSPHRPEFTTIHPEEMRKHLRSYSPQPQASKVPLFDSKGNLMNAPAEESAGDEDEEG